MRCPKCGYFSFDHLESCKKCQKFVGDVKSELNGTVFDAAAPSFLQKILLAQQETAPATVAEFAESTFMQEDSPAEPEEDGGIDFLLDEELAFDSTESSENETSGREELIVDMESFKEVSPREEFTLDLEEKPDDLDSSLPALDFGDLDISDLAPPAVERSQSLQLGEQLRLEEIEPVASLSEPDPSPPPQAPVQSTAQSTGLEDLNFNGLDLDSPSKLVTGSAAGKRYLPSVKTGTALDKFDIDLGDLFAESKK